MPGNQQTFTTGNTLLADVGVCSYNGCTFSPFFVTNISGVAVKDEARRTVKYVQYFLEVDGYVTMDPTFTGNTPPFGVGNVPPGGLSPTMKALEFALTAQGGALTYTGRGFDLVVNKAGVGGTFNGDQRDVAWGPIPELLEFQPLGGGMSAKVRWRVTVNLVNTKHTPTSAPALLQFNCETSVTYGEDYYSTMTVRGTMEIPLTRTAQGDRTLTATVDNFRNQLNLRIFPGIDLTRFRVTNREYPVSRDKRTMEFNITVEEKPYMDLPPDATVARGNYTVRPFSAGMGLQKWQCNLDVTYTICPGRPRRVAYVMFLCLVRERMRYSVIANDLLHGQPYTVTWKAPNYTNPIDFWDQMLANQEAILPDKKYMTAILDHFSIDEGVYLNSKTIGFSAGWWFTSSFADVLTASGVWRKIQEKDPQNNNLWAVAMANVSGYQSWYDDTLDPKLDVVVDFGGG